MAKNFRHTSFFTCISNDFGPRSSNLLRHLKKLLLLELKLNTRRNFLLACRSDGLVPNFINSNCTFNFQFISFKNSVKFHNHVKFLKKKLLNIVISDVIKKSKITHFQIVKTKSKLELLIPLGILHEFLTRQTIYLNSLFTHKTLNLNKKLETLKMKTFNNGTSKAYNFIEAGASHHLNTTNYSIGLNETLLSSELDTLNPSKWLVNLSDVTVPPDTAHFLSLGHNFSLTNTSKCFSPQHLIAEFENKIPAIPAEKRESLRSSFVNILTNHMIHIRNLKPNHAANVVTGFLKSHPNILVTRADKGQVTVLLNRHDYVDAGTDLLQDTTTYKNLSKNKNTTAQNLNNTLVKNWNNKKYISDQMARWLTTKTSTCPRLYLLPKIHKPVLAYRPIVSSINGPLHELGKFIHKKLLPLTRDHFSYIKNSTHFKSLVQNIMIPNDHILISLDVSSLFTNVPFSLVESAINEKKEKIVGNVPPTEIIKAVEIIMHNTSFSFDNKYYQQIFGLPMGSPLAPICADLVMQKLESCCLKKLDFKPIFYYRYVDDILLCIPKDKIQSTVDSFNNYHPRLRFTFETEINNRIPFLDALIIHENNKLSFDWYKKPTFSGRCLNFLSNHPLSQKIAIVINLVDRIVSLSDKQFLKKNLRCARHILEMNGYPSEFVNYHIRLRLEKLSSSNVPTNLVDVDTSEPDPVNLMVVPYSACLTAKLKKLFRPLNTKIISKASNKMSLLFGSTKDKIIYNENSHLIYKINCSDCGMAYIGQTGQYLKTRMYQHQYSLGKPKDNNKSPKDKDTEKLNTNGKTALVRHASEFQHEFDFDKVKILDKETSRSKRNILEMYHIKKESYNSVNFKTDVKNLAHIYNHLIYDF